MLAVPCENDKNIEGHCAVEDNDYCLHEHFPIPRHQRPLYFSNLFGEKTQIFVRRI